MGINFIIGMIALLVVVAGLFTVIGIGVRAAAKGDMVVALVSLVGTLVCLSVIF